MTSHGSGGVIDWVCFYIAAAFCISLRCWRQGLGYKHYGIGAGECCMARAVCLLESLVETLWLTQRDL